MSASDFDAHKGQKTMVATKIWPYGVNVNASLLSKFFLKYVIIVVSSVVT